MTNPNHGTLNRQTKTEGKSKANANQNSQNANSTPGSTAAVVEPPKGDTPQIQLTPDDAENAPQPIAVDTASLDESTDEETAIAPDEEMKYRINYSKARQENIDFYWRFNLIRYNLFDGIFPDERPIAYANATWRLQRYLYNQDIDSFILGEKLDIDGALGPYTFYVIGKMAQTWAEEEAQEAATALYIPIEGIRGLMSASESMIGPDLRNALAEIRKPELLFTWEGSAETAAAIDSYASGHDGFDEYSRELLDIFLFNTPMYDSLSDYQRFEIIKRIYATEPLALTGFAFRVNRNFTYKSMDNKELRNQAGVGDAFGVFTFVTDELKLSINSYLKDTMSPAALNFSKKIGYNDETEVLHGLMVFYHFPMVDPVWVQQELFNYLAEVELEQLIIEVAMQKAVADYDAMVEERKAGEPDVSSMDEFLSVLVYQTDVETSNIDRAFGEEMHEKARNEFGLVVKLDEDSEPIFMMLSEIEAGQARAAHNAANPLKFGIFEETNHFTGISAIKKDNGTIMVTNSSFDLVDEEQSDSENLNNFSINYSQYFGSLEPVIFQTSELNKDDPAIYWLYKNIVNENTWTVNTLWMPAGYLPQVTDSYWKKRDLENLMTAIDLGFTIFGLASIGAAGAIAKGAQVWGTSALATEWATYEAALGVKFVIEKMVIEAIKFGVGEMIGVGLQSLNSYIFNPVNGVSKEFQDKWTFAMKFMMIAGIGSAASITAFKALRRNSAAFVQGPVLRQFQKLEREMIEAQGALNNLSQAQIDFAVKLYDNIDALKATNVEMAALFGHGGSSLHINDIGTISFGNKPVATILDEQIAHLQKVLGDETNPEIRTDISDDILRMRGLQDDLTTTIDDLASNRITETEAYMQVYKIMDDSGAIVAKHDDSTAAFSVGKEPEGYDKVDRSGLDIDQVINEEWPLALAANHIDFLNAPRIEWLTDQQRAAMNKGNFAGLYQPSNHTIYLHNSPRTGANWRSVISHELFHAGYRFVYERNRNGNTGPSTFSIGNFNEWQMWLPLNEYMAYRHGFSRASDMTTGAMKDFWVRLRDNVDKVYHHSLSGMKSGPEKTLLMKMAEMSAGRVRALAQFYGVSESDILYKMTMMYIGYNIYQCMRAERAEQETL